MDIFKTGTKEQLIKMSKCSYSVNKIKKQLIKMSKCSYSVNKIKKQLIKMSKCSYSVNKIKNLTAIDQNVKMQLFSEQD